MNYIWELFLKPGYEKVHIGQDNVVSPYYEINPNAIIENDSIDINVMYRYEDIFAPMLTRECLGDDMEKWYIDTIVHYLAMLDTKSGLSLDEYKKRNIIKGLLIGEYGQEMMTVCNELDPMTVYKVVSQYIIISKTEATFYMFSKALVNILETGVVYKDNEDSDACLLYVGREENKHDKNIIDLVTFFLLPVGKTIRVFWNTHFGIGGEDKTMLDGEIEIA